MRSWVENSPPTSEMPIFISPGREAGYVATFFHSFKNSWWQPVERPSLGIGRSPASCFLCGHQAADRGPCQTVCRGLPRGCVCPQVWIAGHEGPPWRADPILSWFSFQSSESEFSHGVWVGFPDGLIVI